ncbi:MAG: hypothetical protein KAS13_08785 [Candidatus Omnitrophica bacterium]|nr:hypothetical protein [Candidatus Omnitrophota bacterium]
MRREIKSPYVGLKLLVLIIALMISVPRSGSAADSSNKPTVIYQSNRAEQGATNKKSYYSKKISDNEIAFLKEELQKQKSSQEEAMAKQEAKYKGMLIKQKLIFQKAIEESSYPVIEGLEKKILKAEKDLQGQQKANEEALIQKELEFSMKVKTLSDQFDRVVKKSKQQDRYSNDKKIKELTVKIDSLNEKMKIKNNLHEEVLKRKEKEYNDRLQQIIDESKSAEGMDREQEIGDVGAAIVQRDSQIRVLNQRVKDLNKKLEKQSKVYDKEMEIKEKEYKQKHVQLEEKYKLKTEEEVSILEEKLNKKYVKIDEIIRSKETMHAEEIFKREQEIEKTKKQAQAKEKTLRQMTADKELEYGQSIEKEKHRYLEENESLKKSSEQLRIYIVKLKEELTTKAIVVSEKNSQIQTLNEKLALYSGEEMSDAYKISRIVKEELNNFKIENKRQKGEIQDLKNSMAEQKSILEIKLAKQKKTIMNLQRDAEAEILQNSFEWEKKLRIQEAKYIKQIRILEKENENLQSGYERKIEKVSDQLRLKIEKDEKIKNKLSDVKENQMALLEEMLLSKAKMMQKVSPSLKKEQQGKAEAYFKRAMSAILKKNYARAKYELEEVLLIEPENQMTINMLGSINFLLDKK